MSELTMVLMSCAAMAVAGLVLAVVLPGRSWWSHKHEAPASDAEDHAQAVERVRHRLAVIQTTERRAQSLPFVGRDRRLAAEVIVRVPERRAA